MVVKVGLRQRRRAKTTSGIPGIGEQLQDHSLSGKKRYNIRLAWRHLRGRYPDGTRFELRRPVLSLSVPGYRRSLITTSLRMAPALIGMGLLEAIPTERLEQLADPDDANRDGVSGRVHYLKQKSTSSPLVGRFGFRATHPSLHSQTGAALLLDMGITNDAAPVPSRSVPSRSAELSESDVDLLVTYQRFSGVPGPRNLTEPLFLRGAAIFSKARCSECHVTTHLTSASATTALVSSQTIHPYTDLLLHDMGHELSDSMGELAAGRHEWRTPPLWGLGIVEVTAQTPFGYLHDGRARTVEEAILWHGGEASASRALFMHSSPGEREALLYFLRSL